MHGPYIVQHTTVSFAAVGLRYKIIRLNEGVDPNKRYFSLDEYQVIAYTMEKENAEAIVKNLTALRALLAHVESAKWERSHDFCGCSYCLAKEAIEEVDAL